MITTIRSSARLTLALPAAAAGAALAGAGLLAGGASADAGTRAEAVCGVPDGATAERVLTVEGSQGSEAVVTACSEDEGGGYVEEFSVAGLVAENGIVDEDAKREGDGATPAGLYGLGAGFGVSAKPEGFAGDWTQVTPDHVWVDGDATKEQGYNSMGRLSQGQLGTSLFRSPTYDIAQTIGYNPEREPGLGSGIFLHVDDGSGASTGGIAMSEADLLDVLAWQGEGTAQIAISAMAFPDPGPTEPPLPPPSDDAGSDAGADGPDAGAGSDAGPAAAAGADAGDADGAGASSGDDGAGSEVPAPASPTERAATADAQAPPQARAQDGGPTSSPSEPEPTETATATAKPVPSSAPTPTHRFAPDFVATDQVPPATGEPRSGDDAPAEDGSQSEASETAEKQGANPWAIVGGVAAALVLGLAAMALAVRRKSRAQN